MHLLGISSLRHLQPGRGARAQPKRRGTGLVPASLPSPSLCSPWMPGKDTGPSSTGKKPGEQQPSELGSRGAAEEGVSPLPRGGR